MMKIKQQASERHVLTITVDNEAGILAKIAGLFTARGYNIDSLTVADISENHALSRITIVTHGPPQGVGDTSCIGGSNVGCRDLLDRIDELRLKAHIFGHIHEGYGSYQRDDTTLINASTCTERYEPTNPPVIFELG